MAKQLSENDIETIQALTGEKRLDYLMKEVVENGEIWILVDDHGCVMLNTEDEDCVPIWPNKEFADLWATAEWDECRPESISLNKWHSRWTVGLEEDELAIVAFPNLDNDGMILYPDELEDLLKKKGSKKSGGKKR